MTQHHPRAMSEVFGSLRPFSSQGGNRLREATTGPGHPYDAAVSDQDGQPTHAGRRRRAAIPVARPSDESAPDRQDTTARSRAVRFERASGILADCLEREPAERAAFVATATAGDPELEALVTELLRAATLSGTFLDGGVPGEQAREIAAALMDSAPGSRDVDRDADRVAGYEIVEALGAGGFGTVWLARQLEPVRRDVALKVLKPGMDTRDIVARFEQERQSLARMSHENVARVLDAGVTASGRPFFAMELVRGLPITRHCDEERLDVRARLRLFVEACRGVQHAHQRGIIHRDIKPSNVLVTAESGRPIPKVIDFGIAKAIEGEPEDRLVRTQHGEVLGTPAYMSPEQATPGAAADTRTDVYSLGVLLYELLTGMLPFDGGAPSRASPVSMPRGPGDVEARRPSDRLRTEQRLRAIASARGTEPSALRRELRGDLDWIVMTAMASDPDRRYPTVDALVADVERHLGHLPVAARPPSAIYRIGKFARKHRFGVAAASVSLLLLVAGLLGTSYGLAAATRARGIAEDRTARAEERAYSGSMLLAEQAIRSRRLDAARTLLDEAPKELRGWEWSHLAGRLDPDVEALLPKGSNVDPLFGSQDGSRAWTWDAVRLSAWRGGEARAAASMEIPGLGTGGWFWEEDDGAILGCSEAGRLVRVRLEGSSRGVVDLPPIGGPSYGACLDPASGRFYWSDSTGVLLCRSVEGGPIRRGPRLPSVRDRNLAVTRDGARLVAAGHHDLSVIDAATLAIVHATTWPASRELSRCVLSPDDTLVAMGYSDGSVELRGLGPDGRALPMTLPSDPAWVSDLVFSSDGRRLAAGYGGGTVRTWDVASGEPQDALALRGDNVGGVAYVGSRLLVTPFEGGLLSWKPGADEHRRMRGHASYVYAVAILDDGALAVSGGWDARTGVPGGLKLWDVPSRRLVASWGDEREIIRTVAPSPEGTRLWVAAESYPDGRVTVLDAGTGKITARFPMSERRAVNVVALDERRAVALTSAIAGGEAFLLDVDAGAPRPLDDVGLPPSSESNRAAAVSADGRWLALSWGRGGIQLRDARSLAVIARVAAHQAATWSLAFSSDGSTLASASDDGTVGLWAVPSLQLVQSLRGSGSPVMCAAWTPDASRLAAGTRDGGIDVWDPARALLVGRLTGHSSYVKSLTWTPDGRRLLSASGDHDVRIWDLDSAADVATAAAERDGLLARLQPSIDARLAAPGGDAGAVARWIDASADLTPRERQVARQALLRRGLERSGEEEAR